MLSSNCARTLNRTSVVCGKAAPSGRKVKSGGVSQAEVSKMERRTELYVGTLRKFIEAMNGELVIAARFPDGVEIPIRLAEQEDAA